MVRSYDSICCFRSRESDTVRLLWELTTKCNLNCRFCHRTKPYVYGLPLDDIRAIIPKLKAIGISEIIMSGGEPLVRGDIFDIVALLADSGFGLDICTNAYAADRETAKKLSRYFTEISVSLDSLEQNIHNSLRSRDDAYDRTITGIRNLLAAGMDVHVTSLVNKTTMPYLEDTVSMLYGLGVRSVALIGEIPVSGGEYYVLREDVRTELKKLVDTMRSKYSDLSLNTKEIFPDGDYTLCPAAGSLLALDVYGRLSPCLLFGERYRIPVMESSVQELKSFISELRSDRSPAGRWNADAKNGKGMHVRVDAGICPGSIITYSDGRNMYSVIGKKVKGTIDRQAGSSHPRYPDTIYPVNYGYVDGVIGGDGKAQDVYVLGTDKPIETFEGNVIAVFHRFNDSEDKWIVSLDGSDYSDEEVMQAIRFQEQYFEGELIR